MIKSPSLDDRSWQEKSQDLKGRLSGNSRFLGKNSLSLYHFPAFCQGRKEEEERKISKSLLD
jgi:hypothetical protein